MKAPKIENRPMRLVIAAERKIRINKSARAEGEISPPPARKVMAAHRRSSRRATRIMKRAYASASATMVMVADGLNLDRTIALTRARMIQPAASSAAAAVIVSEPKRVRLRLNSINIRPKLGSAVIDTAAERTKDKQ